MPDGTASLPTYRLCLGDWATLRDLAAPLRAEVFVAEQRVPIELEWDDEDADALHAVMRDSAGVAVATGRLLRPKLNGMSRIGRIGRMAVRRPLRGTGLGAVVLHALMQAARERGDTAVTLHAQLSAVGFYQRAGFTAHGPTFLDAGIEHVEMQRPL